MKQPLLVQQGKKELLPDWHWDNYIMGFAKPIEQYLFANLLTEIQVIMYLKDIMVVSNKLWKNKAKEKGSNEPWKLQI